LLQRQLWGAIAAEPWHKMAQGQLTRVGASEARWGRALLIAACVSVCAVSSVGCQRNDRPNVMGPGLDPPNQTADGGAQPGKGEFGNDAGSSGDGVGAAGKGAAGSGGLSGTGGRSAGTGGSTASADAGAIIEPPCLSDDAGLDAGDAIGDDGGDAATLDDCDRDASTSR
jgi:hypothetical protein